MEKLELKRFNDDDLVSNEEFNENFELLESNNEEIKGTLDKKASKEDVAERFAQLETSDEEIKKVLDDKVSNEEFNENSEILQSHMAKEATKTEFGHTKFSSDADTIGSMTVAPVVIKDVGSQMQKLGSENDLALAYSSLFGQEGTYIFPSNAWIASAPSGTGAETVGGNQRYPDGARLEVKRMYGTSGTMHLFYVPLDPIPWVMYWPSSTTSHGWHKEATREQLGPVRFTRTRQTTDASEMTALPVSWRQVGVDGSNNPNDLNGITSGAANLFRHEGIHIFPAYCWIMNAPPNTGNSQGSNNNQSYTAGARVEIKRIQSTAYLLQYFYLKNDPFPWVRWINFVNSAVTSGEWSKLPSQSAIDDVISELQGQISALTGNVLQKNNTIKFKPTKDYNPATKKYVDDCVNEIFVYSPSNNCSAIYAGDSYGGGIPIIDESIVDINTDTAIWNFNDNTTGPSWGKEGAQFALIFDEKVTMYYNQIVLGTAYSNHHIYIDNTVTVLPNTVYICTDTGVVSNAREIHVTMEPFQESKMKLATKECDGFMSKEHVAELSQIVNILTPYPPGVEENADQNSLRDESTDPDSPYYQDYRGVIIDIKGRPMCNESGDSPNPCFEEIGNVFYIRFPYLKNTRTIWIDNGVCFWFTMDKDAMELETDTIYKCVITENLWNTNSKITVTKVQSTIAELFARVAALEAKVK